MSSGMYSTWYERLRQHWVDRAARRTFERLLANPASFRSAPSTIAATGIAVLVLATVVLYLVVLVWGTMHASGVEWVAVGLGWLVALALRPRVSRLSRDARVLERADHPGLHALVAEMARAVAAPAPDIVAVDVDFNAHVTSVGPRGRSAIVLGLPMMSLLTWNARLGVIGHELGHLRGRDTVRGRIIGAAMTVVAGVHYFLAPSAPERYELYLGTPFGGGLTTLLAQGIQALLAAPFLVLSVVLDRLTVTGRQHAEYLADRRAADVVGSAAMREFLSLDLTAVSTAAAAAARRGEDPFDYLLQRPAPTPEQQAARLAELSRRPHRSDATHPPDHLRIRLLQQEARPPGAAVPEEIACERAEEELVALRAAARKELSDVLRFGRRS